MGVSMTQNMKQAISNVLELMFFMSIQFGEEGVTPADWPEEGQKFIGAQLDFSGPESGTVHLLMPVALAREITANFLGLDQEEVTVDQDGDTVKEALNMMGGHMLSLTQKPEKFRLGIPVIVPETETDPSVYAGNDANTVFADAGEHLMAARIT